MEIALRCTYRGKPRGFEEALLDKHSALHVGSVDGTLRALTAKQFGAQHNCMLALDEAGRLCAAITGIGRVAPGFEGSPWDGGDDDKIINIVFTEDASENERDYIYMIYIAFTKSFFELGNKLLGCLARRPWHSEVEYDILYDDIVDALAGFVEPQIFPDILEEKNTLLLYYSPIYSMTDDDFTAVRESVERAGVNVHRRGFLNEAKDYRCALEPNFIESAADKIKSIISDVKKLLG